MFLEAFTHAATRGTEALILSVQCVHTTLSASHDTVALILSVQCVHITLSLLSHQAQPTNSAWNTSDQAIAYFSVFTLHTEISALFKHIGFIIKSKILLFFPILAQHVSIKLYIFGLYCV